MFSEIDNTCGGYIKVSPGRWLVSLKKLFLEAVLPIHSKIIGGTDAKPGQYPHNVFIKTINHEDRKVRVCGGSLITDRHVITAAHCIYQVDYIVMVFGSIFPAFTSGVAIQFAFQSDFIIHPNFVPKDLRNDVAIIKLARPLPLTGRVNTIRLPKLGKSSPLYYEGKEGIVSGWGITSDDDQKMSKVLQHAPVRIMRQHVSRTWFGFFGYDLMNSQLCSRYSRTLTGTCFFECARRILGTFTNPEDHQIWAVLFTNYPTSTSSRSDRMGDPCNCHNVHGFYPISMTYSGYEQGDSGGPLIMRERDGRWTLIGITSFGDKKCTGEVPSVYTNVAIFLPWIRKITGTKHRKR